MSSFKSVAKSIVVLTLGLITLLVLHRREFDWCSAGLNPALQGFSDSVTPQNHPDAVLDSSITSASTKPISRQQVGPQDATQAYLATLDPARFERAGTDYLNSYFSPLRLGKKLEEIDITIDYDFNRVAEVEKKLAGVDRATALKYLFDRLTAGASNNTEKHKRVQTFLHRASFHNMIQPMYSERLNRQTVFDPLVLLELSEMRCGHVARIAVDLFAAAGYEGRIVQAVAHQTAEIKYDGKWHFFEGDLLGNGETPTLPDGTIPSLRELSTRPELIDKLATTAEISWIYGRFHDFKRSAYTFGYPSWYLFSKAANPASFYLKTATPEQERESIFYGWNYYKTVQGNEHILNNAKMKTMPYFPLITQISSKANNREKRSVILSWEASIDGDGDLLGYRVFVSEQGRGWNYGDSHLSDKLLEFHSTYQTDGLSQYLKRFELPRCEVACLKTDKTSVELNLGNDKTYFVTVMPYDAYGEKIGRRLYRMSEEIVLPPAKQ